MTIGAATVVNADVRVRASWDKSAVGIGNLYPVQVAARLQSAGYMYRARLGQLSTGAVVLSIERVSNFSVTSIAADTQVAASYSPGTDWWVRFKVDGTSLWAKAWLDGAAEPASWTATATDSTYSSGFVGLRSSVAASADDSIVVSHDDYSVQVTNSVSPLNADDTFSRVVSGGWGTADSGGSWTRLAGPASALSTDGQKGRVSVGPVGSQANIPVVTIGAATVVNADVRVRASWDKSAVGIGNLYPVQVAARLQSAGYMYRARLGQLSTGAVVLSIERVSNFSVTSIAADTQVAASYSPGTDWWVRFKVDGTSLWAKAWLDGAAEPASWTATATDSTYSSGFVGLRSSVAASADNSIVVSYDDYDAQSIEPASSVELATRFQPLLRFDSNEDWRPLNIETFLSELFSDGSRHRVCRSKSQPDFQCTQITNWRDLQGYRDGWNVTDKDDWPYIDIHGEGDTIENFQTPVPDGATCERTAPLNDRDLMDCDTGANHTSIYWHAVGPFPESNYVYLDYWFFYRFNKFQGGDHEADWEGATIAYPADESDPETFAFVALSAHGNQWHYLRETLICDEASTAGSCGNSAERPHVFVADGSHANHPQSHDGDGASCPRTSQQGTDPILPEKCYDGLAPWGANGDSGALRDFPATLGWDTSVEDPTWVDWWGWWGFKDNESHVESPAALRSRDVFHRPDMAIECTERYTNPSQTDCDGAEGTGASLMSAAALEGSRQVADMCALWNGPDVAASVCDEQVLHEALQDGTLGEAGDLSLANPGARHRRFASSRGISQLVGTPLQPGERLRFRGRLRPKDEIRVRIQGPEATHVARFRGVSATAQDSFTVTVAPGAEPSDVVLRERDGTEHRPVEVRRAQDGTRR